MKTEGRSAEFFVVFNDLLLHFLFLDLLHVCFIDLNM